LKTDIIRLLRNGYGKRVSRRSDLDAGDDCFLVWLEICIFIPNELAVSENRKVYILRHLLKINTAGQMDGF